MREMRNQTNVMNGNAYSVRVQCNVQYARQANLLRVNRAALNARPVGGSMKSVKWHRRVVSQARQNRV